MSATLTKKKRKSKKTPTPALKLPQEAREPLTPRETQVAFAVSYDLDNHTIARLLDISVETVKEHMQRAIKKLDDCGVRTRTGVALWYVGQMPRIEEKKA